MKATYINALSQDADGKLYIATNGSGLLVYDSKEQNSITMLQPTAL